MNLSRTPLLVSLCLVFTLITACATSQEAIPIACYLPTESNVQYSQVIALPTSSPTAVISYGEDDLQFAELWLPSATASAFKHPLVIFIHGGCWLNEYDIKHSHALSTALSQSGYAVWSIEYRRVGDEGGGWPGSFDDIQQAIRHTDKLSDYPIDLNKVALAGHSAGGHLALLAGASMDIDFSTVIGLAAIVDIEQYALGSNSCQTATPKFMGGLPSERAAAYAAANPARQTLNANSVLIQGDKDNIVPLEPALKKDPSTRVISGGGHFDMIHPSTAAYQQLLGELASAFTP